MNCFRVSGTIQSDNPIQPYGLRILFQLLGLTQTIQKYVLSNPTNLHLSQKQTPSAIFIEKKEHTHTQNPSSRKAVLNHSTNIADTNKRHTKRLQ